jgi:hypothetical protein
VISVNPLPFEEEDYEMPSPSNDFSGMEGIEYEPTEDV